MVQAGLARSADIRRLTRGATTVWPYPHPSQMRPLTAAGIEGEYRTAFRASETKKLDKLRNE